MWNLRRQNTDPETVFIYSGKSLTEKGTDGEACLMVRRIYLGGKKTQSGPFTNPFLPRAKKKNRQETKSYVF